MQARVGSDSSSKTNLNKLKEQAEIRAYKKLQQQFSTSEQLEQIDQQINQNEKRKNMVETQLKSAIQSHYISVNSCMERLKDVSENIGQVRNTIFSIQEEYKAIAHLESTLSELRTEATKHKQLKAAKENVKNILNVNDLAKQATKFIEENKLLNAHKCLLDMEKCRNDILEELGPPNEKSNNYSDIKLVEEFFKEVKEIQNTLHNHIFVTIKRMLEVVKTYPEQLVTALRIIEREEILDEDWRKKKDETNFSPADRPKKWRQECKNTIRNIVENRIHGCRIEERDTDESWFSKHLGNICSRVVPDLEIVKKLCEPCFPPSYKIFDIFVNNVQEVLSIYLKTLIDEKSLKDQEYFILISWQDTYRSNYFMGHPSLKMDLNKLENLLDNTYYMRAVEAHIDYTIKKMSVWLQNAMDKNYTDWQNNQAPHTIDGNFESNLPNDINTMLSQQLDLINYANDDRFSKEMLNTLIQLLTAFVEMLKNKVHEFKNVHFKNTQVFNSGFTVRMVTTSNDCIRLRDYFLNIRNKYDKFMDKDEIGGPNDQYERLGSRILQVSDLCLDFIIEDMIKCLDEPFFKTLLSREWLTSDKIIVTIIATSNDYMNDLIHLRLESQINILLKWHNRIKVEYMKGFLQNMSMMTRVLGKYKFSDPNERTLFTNKMAKEILNLDQWFQNIVPQTQEKNVFDFNVLTLMNKVIKADDVDFIDIEIGALMKKCPGITSDMLYALLSLRGDISRNEFKEKYEDYCTPIDTFVASNQRSPTVTKVVKVDESIIILKRELKIQ